MINAILHIRKDLMIRLLLITAIIFISGCSVLHKTGKPHDRDWVYGAAATLEVMDSYSTSVVMHEDPNAYEVGRLARAVGGDRPSDLSLLAITGIHLGILEWSRYWKPAYRNVYQWMVIIDRPGVIRANFKVAFDSK